MITAGSLHPVFADPLHCDIQGWSSCYSIGYQDGIANPGTSCPSGHSDNFCAGWEAGASSGVHLQNSIPLAYATHGKHYLDGFNIGRHDALTGNFPHGQDVYCDRNGGEASEEAGVSLTGKACDEWTKGYDTGFNVTCVFTPSSINDYCKADNQTFPGYIHSLVYDFGFEHGKKYPAGWAGDPNDCSKKYADGGFGGKDSVLLKEFAQCIVGYNKGVDRTLREVDILSELIAIWGVSPAMVVVNQTINTGV
jgi:hypothetical protein